MKINIKNFKEFLEKHDDVILAKEEIKPEDVLLVTAPSRYSYQQLEYIRENISDIFPNNQCLIMTDDHKIEILSVEEDE